jgi:2-dehydro-3-deoxyphosphogluconate aldolase/(4S)-4-hydroxy-2-oxoglutarate aldolase
MLMSSAFPDSLLDRIRSRGVIAVVTVHDVRRAVALARALDAGGVDVLELTLRTTTALDCLRAIREQVPEMLVGAGTVLSQAQVHQAVVAGAHFGVAPGTNPDVIRAAGDAGLPFAPGVMTPTDIDQATQCGCRLLKFFPAEPSGGLAMLASLKPPFAHLGLSYIPLGGVTAENCSRWLADPDVPAVGGSWLAPAPLIDAGRWEDITALASQARKTIELHRSR